MKRGSECQLADTVHWGHARQGKMAAESNHPLIPSSAFVVQGFLFFTEGVVWGGCWEEQLGSPSCVP